MAWSAVGAGIAAAISLLVLGGIPHVQDEVVYQLQARLLTEFRLWEVERLPGAAYPFEFVVNEGGRRYGIFPNGWPAVLALGTALRVPWLVNPLLHGLTVFLGARLAAQLTGPRGALLAAPLLALNPGLLLLASSRMSHTLCALLVLIALIHTRRATRAGALGLGGALAGLILTRPLDGLIVSLVLLPAAWLRRPGRTWLWCLPVMATGAALVLCQNHALEGDWATFPQNAYFARGIVPSPLFEWRYTAECNLLGFGADRGCFETASTLGHTPYKAWLNARINLESASLLWVGTPFLLPLLLPALFDRRLRMLGATALGLFGLLVAIYSLYWYHGTSYGPRFYHVALPLLMLWLAGGTEWLSSRWRYGVALVYLVLAVFLYRTWTTLPELRDYWGVDDRIVEMKREWSGVPSLILVAAVEPVSRTVDRPITAGEQQNEVSFLRRGMWIEASDANLQFAELQPFLVDEMRRRFPQRPTYILGLSADRDSDQLVPIEVLGGTWEQVQDMPLPTAVPVLQLPDAKLDQR